MDDNELWERINALEERMCLLAKFIVKVSHASATKLHLLKNPEGDLTNEESIMLFDCLAKDQEKVLLKGEDAKKPYNLFLLALYVFNLLVVKLCWV